MRRIAFPAAFLLCLSLAAGTFTPARAQDTSTGLTGYPKLSVTVTDSSYELSANSVPAGYVILSVTNKTDEEAGVVALGPPPGMTAEDLIQMASTPAADNGFPPFLYTAVVAGGPGGIQPGQTLEAIVNLPAGDWGILGEGDQPAALFTSVDNGDSVTTEPASTVNLDFGDFSFNGLENGFPTGQQLVKVSNSGKQPHMMILEQGPDGMTLDQVMAEFGGAESGTATAGLDLTAAPGVTLLSSAETMYLPLNLALGTYVALCFVTDPATGAPHAMEGMATTFTVA